MPGDKTAKHNGEFIVFEEAGHSYTDSKGVQYTSVTTLVGMGFEPFDAEGVARKKAGDDWRRLVDEWRENGKRAADFGTRLHENCEMQILGKIDKMHEPITVEEKICFDLARRKVDSLLTDESIAKMEPEKLVFSPTLRVAGSIDLLAELKDGSYAIYDWKRILKLSERGFNGKRGVLEATKDLQDSNFWHYALQLRLYEVILKLEGYVPRGAKFKRFLNVVNKESLTTVEMPDVGDAAKKLLAWHYERVK